jgi:hypothetical protein
MNKRFTPSKKDIEKLNKYLKNGKNTKRVDEGIRNNSNGTPSNQQLLSRRLS